MTMTREKLDSEIEDRRTLKARRCGKIERSLRISSYYSSGSGRMWET